MTAQPIEQNDAWVRAQRERNWLVYQLVPTTRADGTTKLAKRPIDPDTGAVCDRLLAARYTYDEASYLAQDKNRGVGYTPRAGSALVGYDVDACIEPDGTLDSRAQALLATDAYVERSVSGTGLRVLAERTPFNTFDRTGENKGAGYFELCDEHSGKFFTVRAQPEPGHERIGLADHVRPVIERMYDAAAAQSSKASSHKGTRIDLREFDEDTDTELQALPPTTSEQLIRSSIRGGTGDRSAELYRFACEARRAGISPELFCAMVIAGDGDAYAHVIDQPDPARALGNAWDAAEHVTAPAQFDTVPDATVPSDAVRAAASAVRAADESAGSAPGVFAAAATAGSEGWGELSLYDDVRLAPVVKDSFLFDTLLPRNAFGFVASGGSGKSTLALRMSIAVILGQPLWDLDCKHSGSVYYLSREDGAARIWDRLRRICEAMDLSADEMERVGRGFAVRDLSSIPANIVMADKRGHVELDPVFMHYLLSDIDSRPGLALAWLDPLSTLVPDEGNVTFAAVMAAMNGVAETRKIGVGIIHHTSKASAREDPGDALVGRGGSAFADNSRGQLFLQKLKIDKVDEHSLPEGVHANDVESGNVSMLTVPKMSYGPAAQGGLFVRHDPSLWWRMELLRGDAVRAVSPAGARSRAAAEDNRRLMPIVLEAMKDLEAASGECEGFTKTRILEFYNSDEARPKLGHKRLQNVIDLLVEADDVLSRSNPQRADSTIYQVVRK